MSVKNGDSSSTHRGSQSYGLNRLWVNEESPKNSSHRLRNRRGERLLFVSAKDDKNTVARSNWRRPIITARPIGELFFA